MRIRFAPFAVALVAASAFAAPAAQTEIHYPREDEARPAERPAGRSAVPKELDLAAQPEPPELKTAAPEKKEPEAKPKEGILKPVGPAPTKPSYDRDEIERAARKAADREADRVSRLNGRREYYQVGFWVGLHDVEGDPRVGETDHEAGLRFGRRDPEATRAGEQLGRQAAEAPAVENAKSEVAAMFHDLTRAPSRRPRAERPPLPESTSSFPSPTVAEVVHDYPLASRWSLGRFYMGELGGWSPDPLRLWSAASYKGFYDDDWNEPGHVFKEWKNDRGRAADYHALKSDEEQRIYRQAFELEVARRFRTRWTDDLQWAFDHGAGDGWDYGSFVRAELRYREGYREGFVDELEEARRYSFFAAYRETYEAAYGREYDDWSRNPKLELEKVDLVDGDDDGVQEPGETISAHFGVANFGGASALRTARLRGPALAETGEKQLEVPARTRFDGEIVVEARLRPDLEPHTTATLELALGDDVHPLQVTVERPLAIREIAARRIDGVNGRLALTVVATNVSRKQKSATVRIEGVKADAVALSEIAPQGEAKADFDLDGIDPLRLIGGTLAIDVVLARGDTVEEKRTWKAPELAVDLARPDLLYFLLGRARSGRIDPRDEAEVERLVRRRLTADWAAAAAARGNPYKDDLSHGGGKTLLGQLRRDARDLGPGAPGRSVYVRLARSLWGAVDDLPGAHPFLRRAARKLLEDIR